jgi:hypothetical protein
MLAKSSKSVAVSFLTVVAIVACGSTRAGFDQSIDPANPNASSGGTSLGQDASIAGADSAFEGCASSTHVAKTLPAAMLFVLDKSGTMADGGKFAAAQTAIVQAMDQAAFDSMHLGLLGYPTANKTGPACLFGIPVLCGVSGLPQVPLALAGADKSSASNGNGVRHAMYQWLVANAPQPGNGDANPTYDALSSGITALKGWQDPNSGGNSVRILFYITDGGASCASLSSPPRPGYVDGNQCNDWEYPSTIIGLVKKAHDDAAASVHTIVVGVPGASSNGENENVPPYSVRLALSAYAAAGSPETNPSGCTGTSFAQNQSDPTVPCHFDMTNGNYSASALASAIGSVRGSLLGCTFEVPKPNAGAGGGGAIDKGQVNVHVDGASGPSDLYKRKDASNACATDGCWDYDASGNIVLIGKACESVKSDATARVDIVVGCQTLVK